VGFMSAQESGGRLTSADPVSFSKAGLLCRETRTVDRSHALNPAEGWLDVRQARA
jgi:hypothetical protein